jgi:hypothetical protein
MLYLDGIYHVQAAYPICKNCVYFQPHNGSSPMDLAKWQGNLAGEPTVPPATPSLFHDA